MFRTPAPVLWHRKAQVLGSSPEHQSKAEILATASCQARAMDPSSRLNRFDRCFLKNNLTLFVWVALPELVVFFFN